MKYLNRKIGIVRSKRWERSFEFVFPAISSYLCIKMGVKNYFEWLNLFQNKGKNYRTFFR